jgi:hypothetical protein
MSTVGPPFDSGSDSHLPTKSPPTHILTIVVPLRLVEKTAAGPLDAAMALVRLAFPTQVCDDVRLAIEPVNDESDSEGVSGRA